MFCAALLDAFPEHMPLVREAVESINMPQRISFDLIDADGPIGGKRFIVKQVSTGKESHHHTSFSYICRLLEEAPLKNGVRTRALDIFSLLAQAEGRVHRVEPDRVEFHEVGSWDSIADVLSAAVLLETLDVQSSSCAPLPLGGGRIQTAHGILPVPAPATVLLIKGFPVTDDGIPGERVTPTGAAILKSLNPAPIRPDGGILEVSGMGFGTRVLPGIPNCLQVLAIETEPRGTWSTSKEIERDQVLTLSFEVDDQTPEDLGLALEHLRASDGTLSVTSFQGIGKGGRPTISVKILARPDVYTSLIHACFRETTTIGLRWQLASRAILRRREQTIEIEGKEIGVKLVDRPNGRTAKAEVRDLAAENSHETRERLRRLAADQAREADLDQDS